jgi:flagellar biosynthesis anti-sigma factor FlgM
MRIDTNRAGFDSVSTVKAEGTETATTASAPAAAQAGRTDHVRLSPGAQLAGAAVKAAADAPDVRAAEVERAKALLLEGKIGADAYSLADALIDRAIDGD